MTDQQLVARYRNLLIALARHYVSMVKLAANIKQDIPMETNGGRISGLYCYSKSINKRAVLLRQLLMEDKEDLIHFFGTTNLHEIAKAPITIPR